VQGLFEQMVAEPASRRYLPYRRRGQLVRWGERVELFDNRCGHCTHPFGPAALMRSVAFSATMIVGALVLPRGTDGITEASTTRRRSRPKTLSSWSTTDPIATVEVGW